MNKIQALLFALLLIIPFIGQAQTEDQTLSPYFLVKSDGHGTEQFPLLHTEANVNIAGVIADVKVTQVYKNSGDKPIEAVYVFPASTRAAVYNMKMTIGKRVMFAEIQEKQKARKTYEAAKKAGKSASLLEQQRPNVFQMNVANILPNDTITVELFYTELLIPEEGTYEFVYPTVVGPRYSNTPKSQAQSSEKWVANPYLKEGELPPYTFDINVSINAGIPIQAVTSSSHKVNVNFENKDKVGIALKPEENFGGNRDYILKYTLKGNQIENGLLLFEGKEENFFLMMMQPPERVQTKTIPPREFIFIMDISGSMNGFPLDVSKKMIEELLLSLRPMDVFNVMYFAGSSSILSEKSLPATPENIKNALDKTKMKYGGGGTELLPALKKALTISSSEQYARSFVILTDGYISVEAEAFELIEDNLGNANFFTFGIGSSVNRFLIEGMARVGYGEAFIVTKRAEAAAIAEQFKKYIQTPVLQNIKVAFNKFEAYDIYPRNYPDLLAERPLLVYGKYKGKAKGSILVSGQTGTTAFSQNMKTTKVNATVENQALRYLWARQKIQILDDYATLYQYRERPDIKQEVTNLGIKYNLLTKYTSFVAVDEKVRTQREAEKVKQPIPLPEGVSNQAIGNNNVSDTVSLGVIIQDNANETISNANSGRRLSKISRSHNWASNQALPPAAPIIEEVSDEEIEEDISFESQDFEEEEEEEEIEEIFTIVESMPYIKDCDSLATNAEIKVCTEVTLMKYIQDNLRHMDKEVEGLVVVSFVVSKTGEIKDVKLLKGISKRNDAEAIRLIKAMPFTWEPGSQRSRSVDVRYNIPIRFRKK